MTSRDELNELKQWASTNVSKTFMRRRTIGRTDEGNYYIALKRYRTLYFTKIGSTWNEACETLLKMDAEFRAS